MKPTNAEARRDERIRDGQVCRAMCVGREFSRGKLHTSFGAFLSLPPAAYARNGSPQPLQS
jgi:hypothetical protein